MRGTTTTQLLLHSLYPFFFPQYLYLAVSSLLLPSHYHRWSCSLCCNRGGWQADVRCASEAPGSWQQWNVIGFLPR